MRLAQQLYEGVDVKGRGTVGLITYLRTDSTRVAEEADAAARSYIGDQLRGELRVRGAGSGKEQTAERSRMPTRRSVRPTLH